MRLYNLGRPMYSYSLPLKGEPEGAYFLYFCEGCYPVFSEAVIVEPYQGSQQADLIVRGRWELACERALISRGPRCMQACSGELRSAIRSVIEQYTASHASIVASKRRVGQNDCAFSIYHSQRPFFEASYEKGSSQLQTLFSVVTLDGLGLDDDGGVAFLPCLRTGSDGSRDVAGTQSQPRRQCRQCRNQHGDDYFYNFFLSHRKNFR